MVRRFRMEDLVFDFGGEKDLKRGRRAGIEAAMIPICNESAFITP